MATEADIIKIVTGLAALYPAAKITEATIAGYVGYLQDVPLEYLRAAAADCVDRNKWFPSVNELRESAARIASGAYMAKPPLEAWGEVKTAIAKYGRLREPQFSDPVIAATVGAMGWTAICNSPIEDEPSWRARFIELYAEYRRRDVEQAHMMPAVRQLSERQAEVRRSMGQLATSFSMPSRLAAGTQSPARPTLTAGSQD